MEEKPMSQIQLPYANCKDKIFCALCNPLQNETVLRTVPHREWMDLQLICYYRKTTSEKCLQMIPVQCKHVKKWRISEEQLFQDARSRLHEVGAVSLQRLDQFLRKIDGRKNDRRPISEASDVYLLTNTEHLFGAVCMTDPQLLQQISEEWRSGYYILPSSVHECLLLPDNQGYHPRELNAMVREINRTQLASGEFLADHIYHYHAAEKQLGMCLDA